MKVTKLTGMDVPPARGARMAGAFVRASVDGSGCGAPGCSCSPGQWITISDGATAFRVDLTPDEAKALRETGQLESGEGNIVVAVRDVNDGR